MAMVFYLSNNKTRKFPLCDAIMILLDQRGNQSTRRSQHFFFDGTGGICIPTGILLKENKFTEKPATEKE